ncbi:winged helix-turn-helix domain-containing protein [Novosphingobium sp. 9]|uniref:winged helix-turn-helix domain-containing protein n=1 Tax=Novosphingobium sp. 9 TaxID=2025349 RepID=UPI0021B619CE|nr:LysR family transcriptional regulator [Novosphingobium sp. 9]
MPTDPHLKIKIQLLCGDEIAMGPGKADLLDAIRAQGSISAAGRAMDMSYRRAWLLVDAMNRCWSEPLVRAYPGRARGSGAEVTPAGERVLKAYRQMQKTAQASCASREGTALAGELRASPLEKAPNRSDAAKEEASHS